MSEFIPLPEHKLAEESLVEEAAEVTQEVCKGRRFGWLTKNYRDGTTPMERVAGEIGDLLGSIGFFIQTHPEIEQFGDLMQARAEQKVSKLRHHNDPATVHTPFKP